MNAEQVKTLQGLRSAAALDPRLAYQVEALDAALELAARVPAGDAPIEWRVSLSSEESTRLCEFLTTDGEGIEASLYFGDGVNGRGLYVVMAEYPDEGLAYFGPGASDSSAVPGGVRP